MLALLIIIIILLAFMTTGMHVMVLPAVIGGTVFIAFWVLLLRGMIGFGRWLMSPPADVPRRFAAPQTASPVRARGAKPVLRLCTDPRCGRANVSEARYCAQCGRPLGQAA